MPFFLRKRKPGIDAGKKSTRTNGAKHGGRTFDKRKSKIEDEEILSDEIVSSDDEAEGKRPKKVQRKEESEPETSGDEDETAQEKKLRAAKKYLSQLEALNDNEDDETGGRSVGDMLKDDVLEKHGKLKRKVADGYSLSSDLPVELRNGHRGMITACCVCSEASAVFTGGKDSCIIKWDLNTGKRISTIFGGLKVGVKNSQDAHCATITALAASTDFKYLASGCLKGLINIWNPQTLAKLKSFNRPLGSIRGLTFRRNFHQLYSAGDDKMLSVWSLDELAFSQTLFGHLDSVISIDSFVRERAITCSSDNSIRLWKIAESSSLVFDSKGGMKPEIVQMINEDYFIVGFDNGFVGQWTIVKRKPLWLVDASNGAKRPVCGLAALKNTDLFATACILVDKVTLWRAGDTLSNVAPLLTVNITGIVNHLEFTADGSRLVILSGKEHRNGRWWQMKEAKNAVYIIPLNVKSLGDSNGRTYDDDQDVEH